MFIGKSRAVTAVELDDGKTVHKARKQVLIGHEQGAPNFVMRLFTLGEGGYSPFHSHAWEHEIYILSGRGTAVSAEAETVVTGGDFIYVAPDEVHQLRNLGNQPLEFLCLVPRSGET